MAKVAVIFLVLLVAAVYQTDAWFIRRGWNKKNCFCKAVDNSNFSTVLHNFGSIQSCKGWLGCGCRRKPMITCGTECERRVKEWTRDHCPANLKNKKMRAAYDASVCNGDFGHQVYNCGN